MKFFACLVFSLCIFTGLEAVSISSVTHLGRPHLRVVTQSATYLYDPVAGGFSSIIDQHGQDWVAYKDQPWGEYPASAASSYRGVPNLVFRSEDDGAGHPGHQKCSSQVVDGSKIVTESLSGIWAWNWTFTERYARLEITKVDPEHPYWFLYEGPAGGAYRPRQTYWGSNQGGPNFTRYDHYRGSVKRDHFRWIYFGSVGSKACFFMAMTELDQHPDHYSLLGNTESGIDSPDGMVVAGFGRTEGAMPLLREAAVFYIGIYPRPIKRTRQHRRLGRFISRIF